MTREKKIKKNGKAKLSIKNKSANPEIKQFIDFFCRSSQKIRNQKPIIIHGKDGALTKFALKKMSLSQLEQMSLWFLEKKKSLSPKIGTMLSKRVMETFERDMRLPDFWKEIENIYAKHYSRATVSAKLARKFIPFTSKQVMEIAEEVARTERLTKRRTR